VDERDRPANELLYDTEATLRLVDEALDEICGAPDGAPAAPASRAGGPPPLSLVRQTGPEATGAAPARAAHGAAAELLDLIEDVRLGRALLDRARARRSAQGGDPTVAASGAIGNQYLDGAAHLLGELEQRLAAVVRMLGGADR
jgi:hypothetical protein